MTIEIIHHFIGPKNHGGMAVVAQHNAGDSFIEVAVIPCSTKDNYVKKTAVKMLAEAFFEGRTIRLPINQAFRNNVNHRILRDIVLASFSGHAALHCNAS